MDHAREESRMLENLKKQRDASLLHDYVKDMANPEFSVPPSLGSALNFFESELQLYGNIRSLLYASVLGAIVGALLSGLLVRFAH